jgi:hypothetical protein
MADMEISYSYRVDDSARTFGRDVVYFIFDDIGVLAKFVYGKFVAFELIADSKYDFKANSKRLIEYVNNTIIQEQKELLSKYCSQ